ncbi:MAG: ESPR-type extended signal peptide-containing protein [Megasphaera massiliensis]|uniref:ESPR-type extended signal peptide-containing protein n=1 Tax=Megasphaera massiliensis TaxID=1232428 RepID=UPI00266DC41D|nr:ESPR-type extended signal peptide-containing protein [Megasphaera massiliensis]MEE0657559.1 ESPR-type extended signal peptide-containing protein [Megasphaera massiliensis]
MNKIYKVVWSKVKNCYVVVSEIAKSHSKPVSSGSRQYVSAAAVLAAFAVLSVANVATVQAVSDIKVGDDSKTNSYSGQVGSIAIGNNAYVENMAGNQERTFTFGQTDQTQWAAGIAIGQNTYARSGSIMIGDHKYVGALGDVTVDGSSNTGVRAKSLYINSTTLGANAYNSGSFSTVNGSYSIATSDYQGLGGFAGLFDGPKAAKNFGANIYGSLNSIESATSSSNYSGVASSVIGTANRTANSNGALIFGAGNEITNSITAISAPSSGGASAKELQTTLMTSIKNSQSGGATLAIGGGNTADYTQKTSIIGVNNTVKGTSSNISQYNSVTGFNNTATNVDNTIVVGTNRTVSDLANTVVIGTADSATATTASDAVAIGSNANATVDGGVALGSGSVASVASGVAGYDPNTKEASTTDSATWKSTLAAVSVGVPTDGGAATATRQITGVAAGMQDTDAVNVAQLKASKVNLTEGDNVTITSKTEDDGSTTYTIKSTDTNTTLASGTVSYTDGDGTLVLTDSAGNNVTVSGLKNTYVTSAALNGNTLTLTRNDGGTVTVDGIASSADITSLTNTVNANKTHFYSVNSTDTTAGNYNNNGATGTNALAAGIAASAQTNNSVAVGTNARVLGNGGNRDTGTGSIAIGENALVTTNGLNLTSIAMGKGATVLNGSGKQDKALSFTPDNYASGSDLPIDPDKSPGGIAIGANAYARTGSVQIGSHTMKGYTMGGSEINDQSQANLVGMTTIGSNSYNKGALGSMLGAYSVMTGSFTGAGGFNSLLYGSQNFGANVVGSLNSIRSAGYSGSSGIANSIVGVANIAENANGALIYGAGNKITNSVQSISGIDTLTSTLTVDEMADALRKGIQSSGGGGSTLAVGGGNTADYTQNTAIIGVNNTVTGTSSDIAQYNSVTGYKNTATNVDNVTITGINNTVTDTKTAVVIGDNRTLTGVNNNVIIGSSDAGTTTTVNNAVAVGRNTNVSYDGGVALGANSLATVDKGAIGYDPLGEITDTDSIGALNKTQYDALKSSIASSNDTVNSLTSDIADLKQQQSQYSRWSNEYFDLQDQIDAKQTELTAAQNSLNADQTEMNKLVSTWQATGAAVSVGDSATGLTRQITNVAAGTNDTDAVNVAQLKQVAAAAEDAGKTTLNFTGDDTSATIARGNGQTLNITGGATEFTTADNIGVVKDGDNALKVKLAKDLTMADGSIAFDNNVKLSSAGLSNGGQKITNVAAGEADTDAVNVSQLKGSTIKSGAATYADNGTGSMTLTMENGDTVTVNGLQDKYISGASLANNTLTISRNDGTNFTVDNIATMDDISGQVGNVALNFAGDDATAKVTTKNNGTLNITGGADSDNLSDDNIGVVKSADDTLKVKLAKDLNGLNSVRVGGSKEGEGIYIASQTVNNTNKGSETGNYITGLTNTTWNPTADGYVSGRAATEDQLKSVYDTINSNVTANKVVAGKNISVEVNEDGTGTKVSLENNITLGSDTDAAKQVNINGDAATVTAGDGANKVVVDGTNGQVTIGDAANGGIVMGNQSNVTGTKADGTTDSQNGQFLMGLDNTKWDPANQGIVENRAATEGQLKGAVDSISKQISDIDTAVKSSSRVFESDSGADNQVTRKNTDAMKLKGGADANNLSDNNIGVVNNSDGTGFDIKLSKDIKGLNSIEVNNVEVNNKITVGTGDNQTIIEGNTVNTGSVTTGNTTINNDGLKIVNEDSSKNITVQNNNVSMGGNRVQNVGDATESTDAINKGQFDRALNNIGTGMNEMNNRIGNLDRRVDRVGAGAAALAALHPLEFSPEAKWDISAGVGNYRGANAVAIGAFYRPNVNTLVSIGSSYGGGENMINAGVTFRIGDGETINYPSKKVMAQKITDLESVVSQQNDKLEAQSEQLNAQNKKIEELMAAVAALTK